MPKYFMFPEGPKTSNLTSTCGDEYITVRPERLGSPDSREVFIGIAMDFELADAGEAWAAVDADELRDAIDKAMGPREEPKSAKPYRPTDRDRLLRHIEDLEATLTRRNARHEEDQERIRELEEIAMRRGDRIGELEAQLAAPSPEEQLEALEKVGDAREAVLNPPRRLDTESSWAKCIPGGDVERVTTYISHDGEQGFRFYMVGDGFGWYGRAQQALELGLTAEDFGPTPEARREKYEAAGLADWEVELLMGELA